MSQASVPGQKGGVGAPKKGRPGALTEAHADPYENVYKEPGRGGETSSAGHSIRPKPVIPPCPGGALVEPVDALCSHPYMGDLLLRGRHKPGLQAMWPTAGCLPKDPMASCQSRQEITSWERSSQRRGAGCDQYGRRLGRGNSGAVSSHTLPAAMV